MLALAAALAVVALSAQIAIAQDEPENPLEPLDTSRPQATIASFIEQAGFTEEAALAYRADRSLDAQQAYFDEVERTRGLFDLSEVPAASQGEAVEESFVSLAVHEFMAVQAELLAMIMRAVEAAGTGMAFPSTTAYLTRDDGMEGPGALPAPEAPMARAQSAEPGSAEQTVAVDENLQIDEDEGDEEEA